MNIKGKKQLVIGMGKSGMAAAKLLKRQGGNPFVTEKGRGEKLQNHLEELTQLGIDFEIGGHDFSSWNTFDIIVVSPGIDTRNLPILDELNVPVISEVELAWHFLEGQIIGITGSNGKSTTTALIGEIFKKDGRETYVAGNIGDPVSDIADKTKKEDITVLELSSFQLERIRDFSVDVAVLLNLAPDHLDRYHNVEEYYRAKMNIFNNAGKAVINRELSPQIDKPIIWFGMFPFEEDGVFCKDGNIWLNFGDEKRMLISCEHIAIPGPHNVANAMAAAAAAKTLGVRDESIVSALKSFKGLAHRIEFVSSISGVRFYNDSKSTNSDSLQVALRSFTEDVILIAGGYDKHTGFDGLFVPDNIRHAVLIGQTKEELATLFDGRFEYADSLSDALNKAIAKARDGDVVLLSPGCASYDMFDNFEQRGEIFKELVKKNG